MQSVVIYVELVVMRVSIDLILLSVPSWLSSSTVVWCNSGICDVYRVYFFFDIFSGLCYAHHGPDL